MSRQVTSGPFLACAKKMDAILKCHHHLANWYDQGGLPRKLLSTAESLRSVVMLPRPNSKLKGEIDATACDWGNAIARIGQVHLTNQIDSLATELAPLLSKITSEEFDRCRSLAIHWSKKRTRGKLAVGTIKKFYSYSDFVLRGRTIGGTLPEGQLSDQPGFQLPPNDPTKLFKIDKRVSPVTQVAGVASDGRVWKEPNAKKGGLPSTQKKSDVTPLPTKNSFSVLQEVALQPGSDRTSLKHPSNRKPQEVRKRKEVSRSPSPLSNKFTKTSKVAKAPAIALANYLPASAVVGGLEMPAPGSVTVEAAVTVPPPALPSGDTGDKREVKPSPVPLISAADRGVPTAVELKEPSSPTQCPVTLGDKAMRDEGSGLTFTFITPGKVQNQLASCRKALRAPRTPGSSTGKNEFSKFSTPNTPTSVKRKRASLLAENSRLTKRKLQYTDPKSGVMEGTEVDASPLEGSMVALEAPAGLDLSPIPIDQTTGESSQIQQVRLSDCKSPNQSVIDQAIVWNMTSDQPDVFSFMDQPLPSTSPKLVVFHGEEKQAAITGTAPLVKPGTVNGDRSKAKIDPLVSLDSCLSVPDVHSSAEDLRNTSSAPVEVPTASLWNTLVSSTKPNAQPVRAEIANQNCDSRKGLVVKHEINLSHADKFRIWTLSIRDSTETLVLGDSMMSRIDHVAPYKEVEIHSFTGGKIIHLTRVLQKFKQAELSKLKRVILMFGLNDALGNARSASSIGQDMVECVRLAQERFPHATIFYSGIYHTKALDENLKRLIRAVNESYRNKVGNLIPSAKYVAKMTISILPKPCVIPGNRDVIHWTNRDANKVMCYILQNLN